ncbi:SDR family oxidoreductase [Mycobacterium sp. 852002-51057_SCH5723018]|uniref:SDR family NAD(P)-dependent oxidoreductase n=1 Tax=Mycobacterium sp. 852002-51057_SCH5723018 TaxID=1834094 RepID=UPI0018D294B7|nr:SDR family NAD(P)-dependent oxidoreductase [Mycobacterium sp. 852002-51057_SCH5723018]
MLGRPVRGGRGDVERLRGKVAVVTGASQGLGQHIALQLAAEGARVVLAARNAQRLNEIESQIAAAGGIARAVAADLTREEDCARLIDTTVATFGGIDVLVLNVGVATYGRLEELESFAPITAAMQANFFSAAYPTYLALSHLIAARGVIAYVTSGSGHFPMAGYLGYTTSKHAMNGFFEALRLEVYPRGVHVLTINPGDMYSGDGAGRTFIGPSGAEDKIDLSVRRRNDIARTPASMVAPRCVDAIVHRHREVDLSPPIQKIGTRIRPLLPALVDRRIYAKTKTMRSAFEAVPELHTASAQQAGGSPDDAPHQR